MTNLEFVFYWWLILFLVGVIFLPITILIFHNFLDRGYIFSKILGVLFISYAVWILGSLKILPFTQTTIFLILILLFLLNAIFVAKVPPLQRWNLLKASWKIFFFEEIIFVAALLLWSYVRAHEPSIHGLEKFMDFGFVNSIMRSEFFPPKDMWYVPLTINYYYFGHLVTAVLTKLSGISSTITYNLMLATLFALTFTGAFSIGLDLFSVSKNFRASVVAGLLSGFLVTLAGNLHTIYLFFTPYNTANPVPFWTLPLDFNLTNYWYPNATRFIPFTIHEFPIYSFVVSDLHGHVFSIPIVLTIIALLLSLIFNFQFSIFNQNKNSNFKNSFQISNFKFQIVLLSFLLAVAYMTNVWDGIIYFLLAALVTGFVLWGKRKIIHVYYKYIGILVVILGGVLVLTLPFNINFKPFVSGIGIICAPEFLTKLQNFGPFIFEQGHCQRSLLWQLIILHGFWYFWVILFVVFLFKLNAKRYSLNAIDTFVVLLITLSTLLIIVPEFIYVKDIYPAHYRANTMFKLGYQAFIMLGISTAYIICRLILKLKVQSSNRFLLVVFVIGSIGSILVAIYPYFAINSYYGGLKTYKGLDGLTYLKDLYPSYYEAVLWLRNNIKNQPTILEAHGDSYTDYARISANTGLPTVIGWPVHEWLWRGSYDVVASRIRDVETLYETEDLEVSRKLLEKYNIKLIFVGSLERQKYQNLDEEKFRRIGEVIFQKGLTKIYQIEN